MIIRDSTVILDDGTEVQFKSNAYWCKIQKDGKTIFNAEPTGKADTVWLNTEHRALTNALSALEKAIEAVVEANQ